MRFDRTGVVMLVGLGLAAGVGAGGLGVSDGQAASWVVSRSVADGPIELVQNKGGGGSDNPFPLDATAAKKYKPKQNQVRPRMLQPCGPGLAPCPQPKNN